MTTTSYILIRVGGDGEQHYAGMFNSQAPDLQQLLDEARADKELYLVRLDSEDGPLPPVTWAEVEGLSFGEGLEDK